MSAPPAKASVPEPPKPPLGKRGAAEAALEENKEGQKVMTLPPVPENGQDNLG